MGNYWPLPHMGARECSRQGTQWGPWSVAKVVVFNQKGGVGKTTTTLNLAALLARRGRPPLVLDLDPQAHLTAISGAVVDDGRDSLYAFYQESRQLAELVRSGGGWSVIPVAPRPVESRFPIRQGAAGPEPAQCRHCQGKPQYRTADPDGRVSAARRAVAERNIRLRPRADSDFSRLPCDQGRAAGRPHVARAGARAEEPADAALCDYAL